MNILYINHYAGAPKYGMEFRPYYLAKEWIKQGHNVSIIGANFSHLRYAQPLIEKDLEKDIIEGISYYWLKTPSYNSSGIKRIINMITFVLKLNIYAKKISNQLHPDVVIASSTYPLDIYPAHKIAKMSNAKLIFELHDMWPLSPMLIGGYSKNHPFIKIIQRAENYVCKNCDGYVSLLENAEHYLIEHGLKPGKFKYIPNGFCEEEWNNYLENIPTEHLALFKKLKKDNKIIIGYAGGHSSSNELNTLIESAKEIQNKNVSFVLVGDGPLKNNLIQKASDLKLTNIYFLPAVKKTAMPALLENFDITFIAGIKSELHYYGTSSNKVIDYMLAGKPIIFAVEQPNSLIEKVGCGLQIPAENKMALIDTINKILDLPKEKLIEMGEKGRIYATQELNYSTLAKKFIQAIEKF
jgi:glycosyltransferase involved in cell wall biosynthesis